MYYSMTILRNPAFLVALFYIYKRFRAAYEGYYKDTAAVGNDEL